MQASSIEIGCSGIRITSAPPAIPLIDGDPARVAAHHLDDHHAVVRLGGRVQPVDRLGADGDGRVEAEGVVGRREVVVDRLRDADDREVVLGVQPRGDAERVLAADRDERVEPSARSCRARRRRRRRPCTGSCATCRGSSRRAAGAPRSRAARAARTAPRRARASPRGRRRPRARASNDAPRDRADDRVQAGAVAAAGEDPDLHARSYECRRWESNPHAPCRAPDFESGASASSATSACQPRLVARRLSGCIETALVTPYCAFSADLDQRVSKRQEDGATEEEM